MAKCCNFGNCSTITRDIHFFDYVLHRSKGDCLLKKDSRYEDCTLRDIHTSLVLRCGSCLFGAFYFSSPLSIRFLRILQVQDGSTIFDFCFRTCTHISIIFFCSFLVYNIRKSSPGSIFFRTDSAKT